MTRPAGRNGGHGGVPTSNCQAKRSIFLALQELGDGVSVPRARLLELGRQRRPILGPVDLQRVLRRGLRDGWIRATGFDAYAFVDLTQYGVERLRPRTTSNEGSVSS